MKIIIPMAGFGTRFQKKAASNPEYKKPKPFINVRGYPMVRWATGSLPFIEHPGRCVASPLRLSPTELIFIILKLHDDAHDIAKGLRAVYSDGITVITLPEPTRGAAETAYAARVHVDPEEEIIVSDSDHYFDGKKFEEMLIQRKKDVDGIIPVFVPPNDSTPRWSYSLTNPDGTIIKVGEKDRELMEAGAYANIGAYHFSKAETFFCAVENAIKRNELTGDENKKEFYVAPLYQTLIERGYTFEAAVLPKVFGLGTPSDLERFLKECPIQKP